MGAGGMRSFVGLSARAYEGTSQSISELPDDADIEAWVERPETDAVVAARRFLMPDFAATSSS